MFKLICKFKQNYILKNIAYGSTLTSPVQPALQPTLYHMLHSGKSKKALENMNTNDDPCKGSEI